MLGHRLLLLLFTIPSCCWGAESTKHLRRSLSSSSSETNDSSSRSLLLFNDSDDSDDDDDDNNSDIINTHTVQSRIVGGTTTGEDEYPFYVKWGGCGASVVARDVVLTAAHCHPIPVSEPVFIGKSRRNNGLQRSIVERVGHPLFGGTNAGINYDYMLMKLNSPIPLLQYEPIQLNDDAESPSRNEPLTVIGFGRLESGGAVPDTLQQVTVNYIDTATCNRGSMYGGEIYDKTMLCAGVYGGGKDSCQGDSGGPIFTTTTSDGTTMTQVGIVSWGRGCAEARYPGVYSRISGQIGWIRDTICSLSDYPPDYCDTLEDGDDEPDDLGNSLVDIRFDIFYDEYPHETGWAFVQGDNIPLAQAAGSIPTSAKRKLNRYYGQLREGLATFQITDEFNDGICCRHGNGYFQIYTLRQRLFGVTEETLLHDGSGRFTGSRTVELFIEGPNTTPRPTSQPTRPPTRVPRPSDDGTTARPTTTIPAVSTNPTTTTTTRVPTRAPTRAPTQSPTPPAPTTTTLAPILPTPDPTTLAPIISSTTRVPTPEPTAVPCMFCAGSGGSLVLTPGSPTTSSSSSSSRPPTPVPTTTTRAPNNTAAPTTGVPPTRNPTAVPTSAAPTTPEPTTPEPTTPEPTTPEPTTPEPTTPDPTTNAPPIDVEPALEANDEVEEYDEDALRSFCTNEELSMDDLVSNNNNEPFYVIELVQFQQPYGEFLYHTKYTEALEQIDGVELINNVTRTSQFPSGKPVWDQAIMLKLDSLESFLQFSAMVSNDRNNAILTENSMVWFANLDSDLYNWHPELLVVVDNNNTAAPLSFSMALLHVLKFQNENLVNAFDQETKPLKFENGIATQAWWNVVGKCSSGATLDVDVDQLRLEFIPSWQQYARAIMDPTWLESSKLREAGVDDEATFSAFVTIHDAEYNLYDNN
eukprot:CAMPEP_0178912244 /NCGR_PEP_ID=MMETSP0786-20121207/10151_1 /TAXON_ID=186022 /ORGANISM="Thalassionema frauenfeldii, Strain CCMP 1798" /LENGTH=918 /DNA_ID=CAMNT_0020584797 /DNA_START=263 /DNA_END=3019 /DNA_ORIENTATION=-